MWAKTSTTTITVSLIALLTLTLTVPQSAQVPCKQFATVSELLESFELPTGIFPRDVTTFSCDALSSPGGNMAVSLVIQLRTACTTTREVAGVTNAVQYDTLILATVYRRLVTNVRGVIVGLFAPSSSPLGPLNILVTLNEVRVIVKTADEKFVQFYDVTGFASPPFPIHSLPSKFPLCVPTPDLRGGAAHLAAGTHQQHHHLLPRPLRLVAASIR